MKYKNLDLGAVAKILFGGAILGVLAFSTQDKVKESSLFVLPPPKKLSEQPKLRLETVDLADALKFFNSKNVTFLDVREKRYFDYGSVQGAEYLAPESVKTVSSDVIERWKGKHAVVVYCAGSGCGTAFSVAQHLMERGLDNVYVYENGWPEWRSCKLPMTMSAAMKKEEAQSEQ